MKQSASRELLWLSLTGFLVLAWSGIAPHDYPTWLLEVFPALIGYPILFFTRRSFPLTPLAYRLLLLHAIVLLIGGHYTYALVPAGSWLQEWFHWTRNHYDRLGHLMQGFVPAIVTREILLRVTPLSRGKMLIFLTTCVCLAISAAYELFEWLTAVLFGQGAEAFLGTQGDPWDTQWDMLWAVIGSLLAQTILTRLHNRQLALLRLGERAT